jgi:hypothetical protein
MHFVQHLHSKTSSSLLRHCMFFTPLFISSSATPD